MNNNDPFEGIDITSPLPDKPSDSFMAEVEAVKPNKPMNVSLIRGLKEQMVREFVQYLKDNSLGQVHADLSVTLDAMTYEHLDKTVEEFLGDGYKKIGTIKLNPDDGFSR